MPRTAVSVVLAAICSVQIVSTSPVDAARYQRESMSGMCVKYARAVSDVDLRGDAWMWWHRAAGHYDRGKRPAVGAVLVFRQTAGMRRGHVSTVSKVVDRRTILVDHSWLAGQGLRRGMMVTDTSLHNDWSEVRVWHEPTDQLGQKRYPAFGFIYPSAPERDAAEPVIAAVAARDEQVAGLLDVSNDLPATLDLSVDVDEGYVSRPSRFASASARTGDLSLDDGLANDRAGRVGSRPRAGRREVDQAAPATAPAGRPRIVVAALPRTKPAAQRRTETVELVVAAAPSARKPAGKRPEAPALAWVAPTAKAKLVRPASKGAVVPPPKPILSIQQAAKPASRTETLLADATMVRRGGE